MARITMALSRPSTFGGRIRSSLRRAIPPRTSACHLTAAILSLRSCFRVRADWTWAWKEVTAARPIGVIGGSGISAGRAIGGGKRSPEEPGLLREPRLGGMPREEEPPGITREPGLPCFFTEACDLPADAQLPLPASGVSGTGGGGLSSRVSAWGPQAGCILPAHAAPPPPAAGRWTRTRSSGSPARSKHAPQAWSASSASPASQPPPGPARAPAGWRRSRRCSAQSGWPRCTAAPRSLAA
eukprot:scaffold24586_cov111-Isochrysis_galbana.AAC.6